MSLTTGIIIAIVVILIAIIIFSLSAKRAKSSRGSNGSSAGSNNQVYVGNLPYRVNRNALQDYFSRYGRIRQVRIVKDKRTGRSKGFGFVTFVADKEAQSALAAHGHDFDGRSIVVRIAKPRP